MNKRFKQNKNGHDFVVGDIHGCYSILMKSLESIEFDFKNDRLFCVGDLIDRGPENFQCLSLLDEVWFHTVIGNHEDMMCRSIYNYNTFNETSDQRLWYMNGGIWYENLYVEQRKKVDDYYFEKIMSLPISIEIEMDNEQKVGIVHAEVKDGNWHSLTNHNSESVGTALWGRTRISYGIDKPVSNMQYVIHGHTPVDEPYWLGNCLYIDTGVVYNQAKQFPFVFLNNGLEVINV